MPVTTRTYADRCPGVFRPWLADDGAIVRLRIPGGRVRADALRGLVALAEEHGDGSVLLTARANLQVRGLPTTDGGTGGGEVPPEFVAGVRALGLLPSASHELARNILVSPLTGVAGGRVDLRPVVAALDAALLADEALGDLGGRFLFVLDDGRGDVAGRELDLGLMAVDGERVQLRAGRAWGPVVAVGRAAEALAGLAREFLAQRGEGPRAWWHVDELPGGGERLLGRAEPGHPATLASTPPPEPGRYPSYNVLAVPDGLLRRPQAELLAPEVVVTPWRTLIEVTR